MFKAGDRLECIRAKDANGLTRGKCYVVQLLMGKQVVVVNDQGDNQSYSPGRFVDIEIKHGIKNPDGSPA